MLTALLLAWQLPAPGHTPLQYTWANPRPQGNALEALSFVDSQLGYGVGPYGTVVVTEDGGASWALRAFDPEGGHRFHDLLARSATELLAVGESPGLYRSLDGGESWTPVASPLAVELLSLEALDPQTLVAVGAAGSVLRSQDGGLSWSVQSFPASSDLVEQAWIDPLRGFVVGDGVPHETSDGGAQWTAIAAIPPPVFAPYDEVAFADASHGWIYDDFGEWTTSDGGASWSFTAFFAEPFYRRELLAFDAQHLVLSTSGEGATIWESFDGGLSWTMLEAEWSANGFLDLVRAPGGRWIASSELGDLVWSEDQGASWTNATAAPGPSPRVTIGAIELLPDGRAFAGGRDSSSFHRFFASLDAGHSWSEIDQPSSWVHALEFRDLDFGLAGGDVDRVARTLDGGATWSESNLGGVLGGQLRAYAFDFTPSGRVFAAAAGGGKGAILRSDDEGASWQLANNGIAQSDFVSGVDFVDEQTGYALAATGTSRVYRTLDGGTSWTALASVPASLRAMSWIDASTGLVTSFASGIWRTVDGGASWTQVHGSPCFAIEMADAAHGVASTSEGVPLETLDGGLSWIERVLPIPPTFLSGFAVEPRAGGFLLGGNSSNLLVASTADVHSYCGCAAADAPCGNPDASAGCGNSTGPGALLTATNTTSVAADDLMLFATRLPPQQFALLYMGAGTTESPFGDGQRCVAAGGVGIFRFPVRSTGSAGLLREGPGLVALSHARFTAAGRIQAGQSWHFQAWYRDPMGPCGQAYNLSNALSIGFEP